MDHMKVFQRDRKVLKRRHVYIKLFSQCYLPSHIPMNIILP